MMEARLAKPEEAETIVEWMREQDPNSLELLGKNALTLAAQNGELRGAMPLSLSLLIASMPMNPENRHRDSVVALVELLKAAVNLAKGLEIKELYFVGTTAEIQRQAGFFGFEEVPYPVYRRRL